MTHKEQLIVRLNELRTLNELPPYSPDKVKMSVEEIEALIYHLETGHHNREKPKPVKKPSELKAEALARLNVLRKRAKEKPLKQWSKSLGELEVAIESMKREIAEEAQLRSKKGTTKIAAGANTRRTHTDLHNNPIREDMQRMRKKEERQRLRQTKEKARAMALWTGYRASELLAYLLAQANTNAALLAGEPLKEAIGLWLKTRAAVLPQRRGKPPSAMRLLADDLASRSGEAPERLLKWLKSAKYDNLSALPKAWNKEFRTWLKKAPAVKIRASNSITPQSIADELSLDAKAVRVRLRKLESKIKSVWRVPDERWGFKPEHKADIVKLIKGGA